MYIFLGHMQSFIKIGSQVSEIWKDGTQKDIDLLLSGFLKSFTLNLEES